MLEAFICASLTVFLAIESAVFIVFSASSTALCSSSYCHRGAALPSSSECSRIAFAKCSWLSLNSFERVILRSLSAEISILCCLLFLIKMTARIGASKASSKTTTRNKSISKSFYYISVKLLCFLYMQ
ncbi:hypothetical protein D3C72_1223610 [compost metagenome]